MSGVDEQDLSGDGGLGEEEEHGGGDILRGAAVGKGGVAAVLDEVVRVVDFGRGEDGAGGDAVDADAGGEFEGGEAGGFGEGDFGEVVGDGAGVVGGDAAVEEIDGGTGMGLEVGLGGEGAEEFEGAEEVGAEFAEEGGAVALGEGGAVEDGGIVDEAVEGAVAECLFHDGEAARLGGEVAADGVGAAAGDAEGFGVVFGGIAAGAVVQDDFRARAGEGGGNGFADADTAAGDEDAFTGEIHGVVSHSSRLPYGKNLGGTMEGHRFRRVFRPAPGGPVTSGLTGPRDRKRVRCNPRDCV